MLFISVLAAMYLGYKLKEDLYDFPTWALILIAVIVSAAITIVVH